MSDTGPSYPSGQAPDHHPPRALTGARVLLSGRRVLHISIYAWAGAILVAAALMAVGWPVMATVYSLNAALTMALVGAHCAAVVLTLRWPGAGLMLSLAAGTGMMLTTAGSGVVAWPWPVTTIVTQCAVLAAAALSWPWIWSSTAWLFGSLITAGALLWEAPGLPTGALSSGIVFMSVTAGTAAAGVSLRLWILSVGRAEAAEASSAQQDRRRQELEERNRIARELHDVVAHSMSVISVQASTAPYRNPQIDEASHREFAEIADSSRQALGEMRMLLSILRDESEAPTAPEPGIEDIDSLVESTRASGAPIDYLGLEQGHDAAAVRRASPATGLAAYRIIQEALSNAVRHAPEAAIRVRLAPCRVSGRAGLQLTVENEAAPSDSVPSAPGARRGLTGIQERAAAVGGTSEATGTRAGGFVVRAELPLEPPD
ncbi:sensor histidine kinase [Nesterenkonia populi]|uniref:sensor histidine kinase n=1 Tax=Nesterenkonia populi TaxID=1591087 RepID=UPI001478E01C|nr:histidine kinase [Nesterenkonia populi]